MLIGTLAFGLLLAGCGKEEAADKTVEANESSRGVHKTQEEAKAQTDYMAEQNEKIKLINKEHATLQCLLIMKCSLICIL